MSVVARNCSPLLNDVINRMVGGALVGAFSGLIFFSSMRTRKLLTLYGAGVGLGMSYSQVNALWRGVVVNDYASSDLAFKREMTSIQREIELRNKLS